jgi:hypothetical protein
LSSRQKYLTALNLLAPLGAAGMSVALGAASAAASTPPEAQQPSATAKEGVSERLAAVRDAISVIDGTTAAAAKGDGRLAWGNWGWGGGRGWGWPNWNNWHNWRNWGNWFHNW